MPINFKFWYRFMYVYFSALHIPNACYNPAIIGLLGLCSAPILSFVNFENDILNNWSCPALMELAFIKVLRCWVYEVCLPLNSSNLAAGTGNFCCYCHIGNISHGCSADGDPILCLFHFPHSTPSEWEVGHRGIDTNGYLRSDMSNRWTNQNYLLCFTKVRTYLKYLWLLECSYTVFPNIILILQ
jgi:hypothetical protein